MFDHYYNYRLIMEYISTKNKKKLKLFKYIRKEKRIINYLFLFFPRLSSHWQYWFKNWSAVQIVWASVCLSDYPCLIDLQRFTPIFSMIRKHYICFLSTVLFDVLRRLTIQFWGWWWWLLLCWSCLLNLIDEVTIMVSSHIVLVFLRRRRRRRLTRCFL